MDDVARLGLGSLNLAFGKFNSCAGIKVNGATTERLKGWPRANYLSGFIQKENIYRETHEKRMYGIGRGQNKRFAFF